MPKLSEVELLPSDILFDDVSDEAIGWFASMASALNRSFSDDVTDLLAADAGSPRARLASATAIVLDPE